MAIIGAGQAAAQTCLSLRQLGYTGTLTVFGNERYPPYQRPPLSKAYMKGALERDRLFIKAQSWFAEQDIRLVLGESVKKIELEKGRAIVSACKEDSFDCLVLATGSRPRKLALPGGELSGVFDLRTLDDVDAIRGAASATENWVIVGGGYIGLEAAAIARQLGKKVTVIEMADRPLARVAGPLISDYFRTLHLSHGVDVRTGAKLSAIVGESKVEAVLLEDGSTIAADLVLSGIGIVPNTELAEAAGIVCGNGIVVDENGRTNVPNVFAAGDCCIRPLVHYARMGRLESVHNAIEQGKIVAASILGMPRPVEDCPWFWSDQYDTKLQIAGLSTGYDRMVVRGDPATGKFAVFYFLGNRLLSTDAINRPQEFMLSKRLIQQRAEVNADLFSDEGISMKDIAVQSQVS